MGLFLFGGFGGGGSWGADLGECCVDCLVEVGDVGDLDPVFLGDDEDGGGLGESDAFSEGIVGLDFGAEEAGGVDDEWHGVSVGLEELLGEVLEVFLGGDGGLAGEDGSAVVFGELGRDFVLDVASDDGGVAAPDVHVEGEVVADEGDFVVFDGGVDDGEGVGAGGAFEVFELVDGDLGTGGWLDHGGIFEAVAGVGRRGELRDGRQGEEEGGGEGESGHLSETHRVVDCILLESGKCVQISQPWGWRVTLTREHDECIGNR